MSAIAAILAAVGVANRLRAQVIEFATHDATTTLPAVVLAPGQTPWDGWADVKSPGDGRTYAVGTTRVTQTSENPASGTPPEFSGVRVGNPIPFSPTYVVSQYLPGRQVAILQCTDAAGVIVWQSYFYGTTTGQTAFGNGLSTSARAVSVFPVVDPVTGQPDRGATRIAICGDTFDTDIPLAPPTNTNTVNPAGLNPSGFIAVYDGNGVLQWSYLFFGLDAAGSCAITDVSMRIEDPYGTPRDVVTYCGVSSFGFPASTTALPLDPVWPFQFQFPPPPLCSGDNPASGNTNNNVGGPQWDGIVGRLERDRSTATTTVVFQSIVGGSWQDGLFGITEIDRDRFAVVGSTHLGVTPQGTGPFNTFPLTTQCHSQLPSGLFGVVLLFDASTVAAPPPQRSLTLVNSTTIPSAPSVATNTVARDVLFHGGLLYIVGSTDDPGLGVTAFGFQQALGGGTDGFILATALPAFPAFTHVSYLGGTDDDGLTGMAAWNEFTDHVGMVGFTGPRFGPTDLLVASVFHDTSLTPVFGPFQLVWQAAIDAAGNQRPAAVGPINALVQTPTWVDGGLGPPNGGGVSVDQQAICRIVGSTESAGFPVTGGGRAYFAAMDAIHARLSMLPAGAYRSDAIGGTQQTSFTGGTTPACALAPFGNQVGMPAPILPRMLIDLEWVPTQVSPPPQPPVLRPHILLDRPPQGSGTIAGGLLQLDVPAALPLVIDQVEIWATSAPQSFLFFPLPGQSIRFPLGQPPPGAVFTAQFVCFLAQPFGCPQDPTTPLSMVGSPALTYFN